MKDCVFEGIGTAIVTPFVNDKIDYGAFEILIEKQIEDGVNAIVFLGTTGEACTLSENERKEVVDFAVKKTKGRTKIVVGCGANNTKQAIKNYI